MSPRTSSADGTVVSSPSRSTVDVAAVIVPQRGDGVFGLALLDEAEDALSTTIAAITIASIGAPAAPSTTQATQRDRDRHEQQVDQRILELRQDLSPDRHRRLGPQLVTAQPHEPSEGLLVREPRRGLDPQLRRHRMGLHQ